MSISKFEAFLSLHQVDGAKQIAFLRNLYELRSKGSGHRRGSEYSKVAARFGLPEAGFAGAFELILQVAIELPGFLEFAFCEGDSWFSMA